MQVLQQKGFICWNDDDGTHSFISGIHTHRLTLHHIHFLKYDRDTTDCCCCSQSLWIPLQIRHTFISLHVQRSQPLQVLLLGTMLRFYCKFLQQLVLNSGLNREINKFVSYNLQQIIFKSEHCLHFVSFRCNSKNRVFHLSHLI